MTAFTRTRLFDRRVEGPNDPDRLDFSALYAAVAREEEFVWVYRGADIDADLWRGNADFCIRTVRAERDGPMLGLACCHPLTASVEPMVRKWIDRHRLPPECDPEKVVVISCLLVRPDARRLGVSMSLGYDCLRWAWTQNRDAGKGYTHFLIQATSEVARHPTGLIRRVGAHSAARLSDGSEDRNHIVLHYGRIGDALSGDECGEH